MRGKQKKVLFVVYTLEMGGVTSALLNLLRTLKTCKNLQLDVLALDGKPCADDSFPIGCRLLRTPTWIRNCYSVKADVFAGKSVMAKGQYLFSRVLRKGFGWERSACLISKWSALSEEYDAAIAYANDIFDRSGRCITCGCNQFVLHGVRAKKKFAWIHCMPELAGYTGEIAGRLYADFDGVVSCNEACKALLNALAPQLAEKSFAVNNVLDEKSIREKAAVHHPYEGDGAHIVTVGRIEHVSKRMDRIPLIIKELHARGKKNLVWHVVGDGGDAPRLRTQIQEAELEGCIIMHGRQDNPYPYIADADVYVQTSDSEAMPMVILEALLLKTPVVSTDFPAALEMVPKEAGLVAAKTPEAIADAICEVLDYRERFTAYEFKQRGKAQFLQLICSGETEEYHEIQV